MNNSTQEEENIPTGCFNNSAFNENVITLKVIFLMFLIWSLMGLPSLLVTQSEKIDKRQFLTFYMFTLYCIMIVIMPIFYFVKYPNRLRSFYEFFH